METWIIVGFVGVLAFIAGYLASHIRHLRTCFRLYQLTRISERLFSICGPTHALDTEGMTTIEVECWGELAEGLLLEDVANSLSEVHAERMCRMADDGENRMKIPVQPGGNQL